MIRILYQVHEAGVVHRDIKPQNFMLRDDVVFLIDFGLSSVYVNAEFRGHLPAKPDQEHILGTPKYVSLHVHDGKDASRRDDLISVGYVWLFLLLGGKLPWDSVESSSSSSSSFPSHHIRHDANVERRRQKQQLSRVVLHSPLGKYLEAVYRLEFDERPPYANLIDLVVV
jgi:serine/threonine protein kinase